MAPNDQMSVVFVLPADRGHLLYTLNVARELYESGYKIEYWVPAHGRSAVPDWAEYHPLTDENDNTQKDFIAMFCNTSSLGDTLKENQELFETAFGEALEKIGGMPGHLQGPPAKLIAMKERLVRKDVALCVYDGVHFYSWVADFCRDRGVPTLGFVPTPIYLHKDQDPPYLPELGEEPQYPAVRENADALVHNRLMTVNPAFAEGGKEPPQNTRIIGPVLRREGGREDAMAQETFDKSDLKAWCDAEASPIVYVSFGSMLRTGPVVDIARRLLSAISGQGWRILVAANPEIFQGEGTEALGKDVRVEAWVPQKEVLCHPNVKAFVSHCGATSCNEAVVAAVPIVAMPFFDDQRINGPALVRHGSAVAELPKWSFTADAARKAVQDALQPAAAERARLASLELLKCDGLGEALKEAHAAIERAKAVV